jgi:hypothetical protein
VTSPAGRRPTTTGPPRRGPARPTGEDPPVDALTAEHPASLGPAANGLEQRAPVLAPPDPGSAANDSALRSALSVVTTLGPPLTIATALMFYFGWARSDTQARYMGVDVSLFGYSTQDYVLRSTKILFIPLLVILSLALGWLALHHRLVWELGRPGARPTLRTAGRAALGVGLLVAAGAALTATLDPALAPLVVPLVLASGTAAAAYGGWLASAAGDRRAQRADFPPWQHALRVLLVGGVITLALFWELSNYAGVVGRGYASELARSVPRLPRATAFSTSPLGIQAPRVREERLNTGPPTAKETWRYRTTGLRFLVRSGGRMFLLHDGWTPQRGTVIVLPDNDQVRWQFSH